MLRPVDPSRVPQEVREEADRWAEKLRETNHPVLRETEEPYLWTEEPKAADDSFRCEMAVEGSPRDASHVLACWMKQRMESGVPWRVDGDGYPLGLRLGFRSVTRS